MMKWLKFFSVLWFTTFLLAGDQEMRIVEQKGQIFIRHGVEDDWRPVSPGATLQENDYIKSLANSWARIELGDGRSFILPAKALVAAKELKSYTTSDLVLILTSIEISNLPPKPVRPVVPSGAYVIHGQSPANSLAIDSTQATQYLEYEMNGLEALFEQSFWPGVILKVFELRKYEKILDAESLLYKLVVAYHNMNLARRFEQAKEEFIKTYPSSKFLEKVNGLE